MRNKIKQWLISLANAIGDKSYYDFGEPICHLVTYKDMLVVSTKNTVYYFKDGKWMGLSPKNRKMEK